MRYVLLAGLVGALAAAPATDPSESAARALQTKIDTVKKKAAENKNVEGPAPQRSDELEVSEIELASYVLFEMRSEIPVELDSMSVTLGDGAIGADVRLNLSEPTGTALIDTLIGGRHNLFLKGKLAGSEGRGKFDLQEVRVDGLPVPRILVESLISRYVTPRYPSVDLKKTFGLPWGIQRISIESHKGKIAY